MKPDTIARIIVLAITLLNQFLVMLGKAPMDLDENTVYVAVSGVWTIIWSAWCCWKNNSFTKEAIMADEMMHQLKAGRGDLWGDDE